MCWILRKVCHCQFLTIKNASACLSKDNAILFKSSIEENFKQYLISELILNLRTYFSIPDWNVHVQCKQQITEHEIFKLS
jgi:hypothetical protein